MSKKIQTSLSNNLRISPWRLEGQKLWSPKVGKDLKTKALWAVGLSLVAILIYVAFRFHEISTASAGLWLHCFTNVIVVYGAISIAGIEYSLNVMAVILNDRGVFDQ